MIANSTYTVEVGYYAGGAWSTYGPACTIVTPGTVPRYAFTENEEVTLDASTAEFTLSVYPNPSTQDQELSIELKGLEQSGTTAELSIFDLMGKKVYFNSSLISERTTLTVKPENRFARGIYLLEARMGTEVKLIKFVVE
jgi:hypothetical protein